MPAIAAMIAGMARSYEETMIRPVLMDAAGIESQRDSVL